MMHARRGLSLIETAIVLAIAGLVAGAIWVVVSGIYYNNRLTQAQQQLELLVENTRSHYASQAAIGATGVAGNLTDVLRAARVFPADMFNAGTNNMFHPWGPLVQVWGLYDVRQWGNVFWVYYENVPRQVCFDLLAKFNQRGAAGADPGAQTHRNINVRRFQISPAPIPPVGANYLTNAGRTIELLTLERLMADCRQADRVSFALMFPVDTRRN